MAFRNLGRSLVAVLCVSIFLQVPVLGRRDIRQVSSRRANDRRRSARNGDKTDEKHALEKKDSRPILLPPNPPFQSLDRPPS